MPIWWGFPWGLQFLPQKHEHTVFKKLYHCSELCVLNKVIIISLKVLVKWKTADFFCHMTLLSTFCVYRNVSSNDYIVVFSLSKPEHYNRFTPPPTTPTNPPTPYTGILAQLILKVNGPPKNNFWVLVLCAEKGPSDIFRKSVKVSVLKFKLIGVNLRVTTNLGHYPPSPWVIVLIINWSPIRTVCCLMQLFKDQIDILFHWHFTCFS